MKKILLPAIVIGLLFANCKKSNDTGTNPEPIPEKPVGTTKEDSVLQKYDGEWKTISFSYYDNKLISRLDVINKLGDGSTTTEYVTITYVNSMASKAEIFKTEIGKEYRAAEIIFRYDDKKRLIQSLPKFYNADGSPDEVIQAYNSTFTYDNDNRIVKAEREDRKQVYLSLKYDAAGNATEENTDVSDEYRRYQTVFENRFDKGLNPFANGSGALLLAIYGLNGGAPAELLSSNNVLYMSKVYTSTALHPESTSEKEFFTSESSESIFTYDKNQQLSKVGRSHKSVVKLNGVEVQNQKKEFEINLTYEKKKFTK